METDPKSKNWDNYWNSSNINREIMQVWAAYFVGSYEKYFGLRENDVVLDFGAGYGNVSYFIINRVKRIYLYDKSEYMQDLLRFNFQGKENMYIVSTLEEIDEKVSIIIVNSVSQYIKTEDFKEVLKTIHSLSYNNTHLIIADVIPQNYSKLSDFFGQLSISLKYGFFSKLMIYTLSNTIFSPSLSLSSEYLIKYDVAELIKLLADHGFDAEKMKNNFTYSRKRYTLSCRVSYRNQ